MDRTAEFQAMDPNFHIQTIKSQVENLKFLIEKIEKQNNNSMNKIITPYFYMEKDKIAL